MHFGVRKRAKRSAIHLVSSSLNDNVVELGAPERDLFGQCIDVAIRRGSAANNELEALAARVASIRRVILRPYKRQLVLSDVHALKVKEDIRVENALDRV